MAKSGDGEARYPSGMAAALAGMQKHFGSKPLFQIHPRRFIPLRHRALAELLGGPGCGLPTGCFVEMVGGPGAGKTTVAMALAEAVINQDPSTPHVRVTDSGCVSGRAPRVVAYMDFEHTMDPTYMAGAIRGGVLAQYDQKSGRVSNLKEANLYVHQPETLEEGGEVAIRMMASGEVGLLVIDSVPAMLPQAEQAKGMEQNTVGELARGLGKFYRRATALAARQGVTVLLINQWRDKIGIAFGDPRVTPGGKAGEYFDSIKLDLSGTHRTDYFDDGKICRIKTIKNKVTGCRGRSVEYHIGKGIGLSAEAELTSCLVRMGLVKWGGKPSSPVTLLDKPSGVKVRACKDMGEWLRVLRNSPLSVGKYWKLCDGAGVSPEVRAGSNGWNA